MEILTLVKKQGNTCGFLFSIERKPTMHSEYAQTLFMLKVLQALSCIWTVRVLIEPMPI